ncbi:MAG: twin-arginine translocation signal domain-containing protein [Desulfobulbaceae bacterium]|nr:twin-arginine translocation signal domain-containing protein [Desulfobulbaceae bacterium]
MKRREFLKKSGAATVCAAGMLATSAPSVWAKGKKFRWNMVTSWPPNLPVLQTGAERFASRVKEMSEGRLQIHVFAGGELVPPMGVFDAVSGGNVQLGSSAAYYWAGKIPAAQWFTSVPFGLNAQGMNSWLGSGGLKLWEEIYDQFNLIPRPLGNTGMQMGGWFRREINAVSDFQGLKMRIPGLGGKVVAKAGGTVVLRPGAEIFTSLERGMIDATEWVGPMHDLRMGFYKAAPYYYYPGWHEPGSCIELLINKKAYLSLPKDLQMILDSAAAESNITMLNEFEAGNGAALIELVEKHQVKLRRFPDEVLSKLKSLADETLEEEAAKSKLSLKVHQAFKKYKKEILGWGTVSEKTYYDSFT